MTFGAWLTALLTIHFDRVMRRSIVCCASLLLLAIATFAGAQGEWRKTWVLEDDTYVAGLSAMAISYDDQAGTVAYHFVYEKILAANPADRRLYYRRYRNGVWEADFEISNRIAQPSGLTDPDDGISYLPSIITGDTTDHVHISARLDCTTTAVAGQSAFASCANAALQLEDIIVAPDARTYTARPIDVTNPMSYERGLSQMSMTGQTLHSCWRVELTPIDREVYCAERHLNQNAWGPPMLMTGGQPGKQNHGYLLHPSNRPKRLSFTTNDPADANPKAAAIRLNPRHPSRPPKWLTISDPTRRGDFSWMAETLRVDSMPCGKKQTPIRLSMKSGMQSARLARRPPAASCTTGKNRHFTVGWLRQVSANLNHSERRCVGGIPAAGQWGVAHTCGVSLPPDLELATRDARQPI